MAALGISMCSVSPLSGQSLDMDLEERISADKPFFDETKADIDAEKLETRQTGGTRRETREIKYTAGADKKWFTKDDDVYEYYLLSYDDKGNVMRKSGYVVSDDRLPMTKDDVLHDYLVYEYDAAGKLSRETFYDGAGAKQYTGMYAYDDAGQKTKMTRLDPQNKETGSMNFFYGAGSVIQDVEYKGSEIEKYHRFKYGHGREAERVTEYLGSAGGKGKDGVWFTDDDVVTSAKRCYFNADGTKDKERKFIAPGPDKKWFTKDDVIQYYTLFYYQ